MEVEDVYKLLHQSVAGPAHAIEDPDMARQWLDREWDSLGEPFENEEVILMISKGEPDPFGMVMASTIFFMRPPQLQVKATSTRVNPNMHKLT